MMTAGGRSSCRAGSAGASPSRDSTGTPRGNIPMTAPRTNTTLQFYPKGSALRRYFALWYFSMLLVVWTILGHTVLGFEQAWIHPIVGLGTALFLRFLLETTDAWATGRRPGYLTSKADAVNFWLPAFIPGLASAMLIYCN